MDKSLAHLVTGRENTDKVFIEGGGVAWFILRANPYSAFLLWACQSTSLVAPIGIKMLD